MIKVVWNSAHTFSVINVYLNKKCGKHAAHGGHHN